MTHYAPFIGTALPDDPQETPTRIAIIFVDGNCTPYIAADGAWHDMTATKQDAYVPTASEQWAAHLTRKAARPTPQPHSWKRA